MGYVQYIGDPGGVVPPRVAKELFDKALQFKGQPVKLYHKPQVIDCPCVHPTYNSADPNCTTCDGTGSLTGYSSEPDESFIAAIFIQPEHRQDQHQELQTRIGPVQSLDGRMYCEGRWYSVLKVGDLIIFKQPHETLGTEMRIIHVAPRTANMGEVIFVRCDLEKQPTTDRIGAANVKSRQ